MEIDNGGGGAARVFAVIGMLMVAIMAGTLAIAGATIAARYMGLAGLADSAIVSVLGFATAVPVFWWLVKRRPCRHSPG